MIRTLLARLRQRRQQQRLNKESQALLLKEVRRHLKIQGIKAGPWKDQEVLAYCIAMWASVLVAMNHCRGPVMIFPADALSSDGTALPEGMELH